MPVSRTLRNALYFVVGFMLAVVSCMAFAADGTDAGLPNSQIIPAKAGFNTMTFATAYNSAAEGCADVSARNGGGYTLNDLGASGWSCTKQNATTALLYDMCGPGYIGNFNPVHTCKPYGNNNCPPNSTLVGGRCQCGAGFVFYDNQCKAPVCTSKAQTGSYDSWGGPDYSPPLAACIDGCMAGSPLTVGSPSRKRIVNGVDTYPYSTVYGLTGNGSADRCSAPNPTNNGNGPPESCGSGQGMIKMDGVTKCINTSTGKPVNTSPPTSETKTNNTSTTNNPDGGKTVTNVVNNTTTGGTTTITNVYGPGCSDPATCPPISTTTSTTGGGAHGEAGGNGEGDGEDFCAKHPDSLACKNVESGDGAAASGLYTPETGKSFTQSMQNFQATVSTAPFMQGISSFFNVSVPAGACSGLSVTIPVFDSSWNVDMTNVFCSTTADAVFLIISLGLMLGASYVAFRWAFY
jgi:hypothetical protein